MKPHLAFIRDYKDALRLRLNAAEDLPVNGRREPTDRGVAVTCSARSTAPSSRARSAASRSSRTPPRARACWPAPID